jgi:hypothetical protein
LRKYSVSDLSIENHGENHGENLGENLGEKPEEKPEEKPARKFAKKAAENQVIFSGIQPTGVPHLGNYLGALQQWVKLQNETSKDTRLLFSIVDLHAITVKQDPKKLRQWRKEMLASLLAVGLDPKRCAIFNQSSVKQHTELMWLLSCHASMGYLGRMTQWKVRISQQALTTNNTNMHHRPNSHSLRTPPPWTPPTTKTP